MKRRGLTTRSLGLGDETDHHGAMVINHWQVRTWNPWLKKKTSCSQDPGPDLILIHLNNISQMNILFRLTKEHQKKRRPAMIAYFSHVDMVAFPSNYRKSWVQKPSNDSTAESNLPSTVLFMDNELLFIPCPIDRPQWWEKNIWICLVYPSQKHQMYICHTIATLNYSNVSNSNHTKP